MSVDIRALKDRAAALHAKRKYDQAAAEYLKVLKEQPSDVLTRQRVADLLVRCGRNNEAIVEYQQVAGRYAVDGQLLKAIAICKIILGIDPGHTETGAVLANIYAKQREQRVTVPASMTASLRLPSTGSRPAAHDPVVTVDEAPLVFPERGSAGDDDEDDAWRKDEDAVVLDVSEASDELVLEAGNFSHIPLFSDLPADAFVTITESLQLHNAPAGTVLVREGDAGNSMFAIVQGTVQVLRPSPDGRPQLVAEMGGGTFFGEMALVTSSPRLATVVAGTDCVLLELERRRVEELVHIQPSVGAIIELFHRERLIANLLRSCPLFQPLSETARDEVSRQFETVNGTSGLVFVQESTPSDGFYVVLRGQVEAWGLGPDGTAQPLTLMREGDFFGEISMLLDRPASATVRARTSCVLLRLPRGVFVATVVNNPEVHHLVSSVGRARLQRTADLHQPGLVATAYNV